MKRPVLVLDSPGIEEKIKDLISRASEKYIPLEEMIKLAKGDPAPDGFNHEFTMEIPTGFAVTYTHEEQPGAAGICRHMSASIFAKDVPSIEEFKEIMKAFGFINTLGECAEYGLVWEESFGLQRAINVVEPVDGNFEKLLKKEPN